ncbi:MAG TPA: hypothetical protein VHT52_10030 [Stellaceae bacterium]|nr:hypothetical protein [Stellaceae bacterium]
MPPWSIVLSSAIGAIVLATALAVAEVMNAPRSEVGTILISHFPVLAVGALGVYGLGAMLLTTINLVANMMWARRHLGRVALGRTPAWRGWIAALGTDRFRRFVTRSALAGPETADTGGVPSTPFTGDAARSEVARRYYISLARSHFISVLIVLVGIVGLGAAQSHGALPFQTGAIPTVSAILIVAGLVLLAALGRIAIDVTAEPLLETIAQLTVVPEEILLLRRVVSLLEAGRDQPAGDDGTDELPTRFPERLAVAFEQGHLPFLDAVSRLSEITQALEAAMRSSVEVLETTMRSAAAQQPPADGDKIAGAMSFPELQAAVEELTAVLRRLSAAPENMEEATTLAAHAVPARRKAPAPGLARELRRLLQEIDATQ